eukprot:scaffold15448_cov43-Attheya_sp.AAC.2
MDSGHYPCQLPPHVTPTDVIQLLPLSHAQLQNESLFIMIRIILIEMGHAQPTTPIQVDNSCAAGIANNTVKQRRSKAIDICFYWLKDRECQHQFHIHWRKGAKNLADYFTKHHSPAHHRRMRPTCLLPATRPNFTLSKSHVSGEGVLMPGFSPPHPGYLQKHLPTSHSRPSIRV